MTPFDIIHSISPITGEPQDATPYEIRPDGYDCWRVYNRLSGRKVAGGISRALALKIKRALDANIQRRKEAIALQ